MVLILFSFYTGIVKELGTDLTSWAIQISTFAMLIGVVMLFQMHVTRILRKRPGWPYSVVIFVFFFFYLAVQYSSKDVYQFVLVNIYTPLTMVSGTGVVGITLFYRGGRVRSVFSAILMGTMITMALYQTPFIGLVLPGVLPIGNWLKDIINTGVMRAITIGMGLGLLTVVIRIVLGMETSYLGEKR